jgi:hypothetical protein
MIYSFYESLRLLAFYTLALIGAGTVCRSGVNYLKKESLYLLQTRFPGIYVWLNSKYGWIDDQWTTEIEKILPFTKELEKEIEKIEDEKLKDDVKKTLNQVTQLILYTQEILQNKNDYLSMTQLKFRFHDMTNQLFTLFEQYYYR